MLLSVKEAFVKPQASTDDVLSAQTPTRDRCLPLLISCLAAINKKVHFNFFSFFFKTRHHRASAILPLISSVWISLLLCCLLPLLYGGGFFFFFFTGFQSVKKALFLLLWLAKDPSPPKVPPKTFPRLTVNFVFFLFFVRSYTQGAVIVQIHVHVQYWPLKQLPKPCWL